MADRILRESGGTDGYQLEDGSGVLLLEVSNETLTPGVVSLTTSLKVPTVTVSDNQLVTPTTLALRLSEYERLLPDSIVSQVGFAGATLAEFQTEDADTGAATTTSAAIRLSFPTPVTTPSTGALSRLEALIYAGTSDTTAAVEYHQSGSLVVGSGNVVVPANTTAWVSVDIPSASITDAAGGQARITLNVVGSGADIVRWLVNSGLVPVVTATAHQVVTPTTKTVTLTTFAPVLKETTTPITATLATATFAPTVSTTDNQLVTPTTKAVSLATFVPTVTASAHQTVTPTTGSLTTSVFAPTVAASNNQAVIPGTTALVLSPFVPTVTAVDPKLITALTASLNLSAFAPTVLAGQSPSPGPASLALTAFAPVVSFTSNVVVTPDGVALLLTAFGPTIINPATLTPATASLVLTAFAPIALEGVTNAPGLSTSSVNVASAIISIGFGQAQSANSQRDSSQSTNRQRDSSRSTTGE